MSLEIYEVHRVLPLLLSFWWGDDFSPPWFWFWRGQTSSISSKCHFIVTAFPRGLRTNTELAGRPAIKQCSKQMPRWRGKWMKLAFCPLAASWRNQSDNLMHSRKSRHHRIRQSGNINISYFDIQSFSYWSYFHAQLWDQHWARSEQSFIPDPLSKPGNRNTALHSNYFFQPLLKVTRLCFSFCFALQKIFVPPPPQQSSTHKFFSSSLLAGTEWNGYQMWLRSIPITMATQGLE